MISNHRCSPARLHPACVRIRFDQASQMSYETNPTRKTSIWTLGLRSRALVRSALPRFFDRLNPVRTGQTNFSNPVEFV